MPKVYYINLASKEISYRVQGKWHATDIHILELSQKLEYLEADLEEIEILDLK